MSDTVLQAKTNFLKNKSPVLSVQESKRPKISRDLMPLFQSNTAARSDSSNQWTIDVFPNMVPITMYIMLTSIAHANDVDHRTTSKVSVATICMYHLSIVYGYFLLNDMITRASASAHARPWIETSWKREFADFLLTLPVPEFLTPFLSQFQHFTTDRTKNVFFTPSAAGFDHNIFFGRVFPLNMFSAIHDCTATLPGNTPRIQVLQDLYSRVLYTITAPGFTCLIPDLIGVTIDQTTPTTANYMNSKLYQVYTAVFNPVLFRDFQHRSSLAALSFQSPVFANNHVNAYDLLFSASAANLRELKVVLQVVSTVLDGKVTTSGTLGDFLVKPSGALAIKHAYSTYALPTWSYNTNATKSAVYSAITTMHLTSERDRAQDICFLQRPAAAFNATTEVTDVTYAATATPAQAVQLPTGHQLTRHFPFSLLQVPNGAEPFPRHDNDDLVQFSDFVHTAPSVLVLDTDGELTISAHLPLLAGKIIESFEIDGSTIEMPNVDKSLGLQNCLFADSAVSYRLVRPGSAFHPQPAGSINPPLNRVRPNPRPRLPASSLLYDRTQIMLPNMNNRIVEARAPDTLPGMTRRAAVNFLRYAQSFFGFHTVDSSSNALALDTVPGMTNGLIHLWSPYSYTPFENDYFPDPDLAESRHYFLSNLRTIFGTDYNLVQAKHPYEALPVV
jgi:hypothetical protein